MLQYQLHGDMPIRMDGDASCLPFVKHAIEDVDAIVCANDFTAFRLQQSLIKLNVRVPEDLRLIGFDDVRHATLANVALTTVRQPCRELAWCAFRTLEERILHAAHPSAQRFSHQRLLFVTPAEPTSITHTPSGKHATKPCQTLQSSDRITQRRTLSHSAATDN